MAALPPLHLRLANPAPTGVPVKLTDRPPTEKAPRSDEGESAGKQQRTDAPNTDTDNTGKKPAEKYVANFTKPGEALDRLDVLLQKLRVDYSNFVDQWRLAICKNLTEKRKLYNAKALAKAEEIYDEHGKQLGIYREARRPYEAKGEDPDRALITNKTDNVWDMMEKTHWRQLNDELGEIMKLQAVLQARIDIIKDDDQWATSVALFINTLAKLADYPDMVEMIEKIVDSVYAFVRNPLIANSQYYNVVLMGAAGTGKTRLAGIIGDIFGQLGMYVHTGVVEATAGDFIGQYLGETAQKTRSFLARSLEHVVFLDEAYALTHYDQRTEGGDPRDRVLDQYSAEAVNVLIPFLSKNVGQIAMIVAGYEDKMKGDFLSANEGMDSRFPIKGVIDTYGAQRLYEIFIAQLALTYIGVEPPREDIAAYNGWNGQRAARIGALLELFRPDAQALFYDVFNASMIEKGGPEDGDKKDAKGDDKGDDKKKKKKGPDLNKKRYTEKDFQALKDELREAQEALAAKDDAAVKMCASDAFDRAVQRRALEILGVEWKQQREEARKKKVEEEEGDDDEEEEEKDPVKEMADEGSKSLADLLLQRRSSKNADEPAYKYPLLHDLFASQARAMANMAGVAAALILGADKPIEKSYADRTVMFNIILTFMQTKFTGEVKDDKGGVLEEDDAARDELIAVLKDRKWMELDGKDKYGNDRYKWTEYTGETETPADASMEPSAMEGVDEPTEGTEGEDKKDESDEGKKASFGSNTQEHITADRIKVKPAGKDFLNLYCATENMWKPELLEEEVKERKDKAAKKAQAAKKKEAKEAAEAEKVAFDTIEDVFRQQMLAGMFTYIDAEGKPKPNGRGDLYTIKAPPGVRDNKYVTFTFSKRGVEDSNSDEFNGMDKDALERMSRNFSATELDVFKRYAIRAREKIRARIELEQNFFKQLQQKFKKTQDAKMRELAKEQADASEAAAREAAAVLVAPGEAKGSPSGSPSTSGDVTPVTSAAEASATETEDGAPSVATKRAYEAAATAPATPLRPPSTRAGKGINASRK